MKQYYIKPEIIDVTIGKQNILSGSLQYDSAPGTSGNVTEMKSKNADLDFDDDEDEE